MALDAKAVEFAAKETNISPRAVLSVLVLMVEEECTVPFIARYRKEKTGDMDEVQIRDIKLAYDNYIEREKRREAILKAIKEMEKLTPELEKLILAAESLNQLEDIYAPYKSKKKTKGQLAEDAGLLPLAEIILTRNISLQELVKECEGKFLNPDAKIVTWSDALSGAKDIIIEKISHDVEVKEKLRTLYWEESKLVSSMKKEATEIADYDKFKDYFEFSQSVKDLKDPKASHRFLAMRRGTTLKILKVDVDFGEERACNVIGAKYLREGVKEILTEAVGKAYRVYIHPSLDLEIKSELKKIADEAAISVFGANLKNLLLAPYLGAKTVLGVDPGVRTGCKIVVVDATGKLLIDGVIYPHEPKNDVEGASSILTAIIAKLNVRHIAIGNGTYGRETLEFINEYVMPVKNGDVKATLVSEAGASIYSASDIARKEFPDKDVTVRGAVSIARRFQDPLAELVKIDAKSIGVGQYQHDVNQTRLQDSLDGVVESCVNYVGVDLNTASAPLLSYISGIGPTVAENVVKQREAKGGFKKREELLEVSRFSAKVYEQAAGFLRIYGGVNPLDSTFIHPERYKTLEAWAQKNGVALTDLISNKDLISKLERDSELRKEIDEFTLKDIVKSLSAPSQDPRTEFKSTDFRKDAKDLNSLHVGEWYPGIVNNLTKFGAFVDIGIKESGLIHISEMADHFVEDAMTVLKVGQEVKVRVLEIDRLRKRVSLSMKSGEKVQRNSSSTGASQGGFKGNLPQPKEIRNNAFAGLKNLKLK